MLKGIAAAVFGFGVIMTVVVWQPASIASVIVPNSTIVKKNVVFPLKENMTVETCAISHCADV